jgi:hypothetical protein
MQMVSVKVTVTSSSDCVCSLWELNVTSPTVCVWSYGKPVWYPLVTLFIVSVGGHCDIHY